MGKNPSEFKHSEAAPRRPVENVSWDDVMSFLQKLKKLLPPNCEAVLPSESQWEYACRAGTQTEYWWGDAPNDVHVNWKNQHGGTTSVDRYPPNPWGLYDMHGNVWEWCRDPACDYRSSVPRAGDGLRAASAPTPEVILRGGGYFDIATRCRSTFRFVWPSSNPHAVVGLRPVRYIRKPH
jgi:formylglycine-generating enzyme required for sulfatase activity